jgi:hypothetical protein
MPVKRISIETAQGERTMALSVVRVEGRSLGTFLEQLEVIPSWQSLCELANAVGDLAGWMSRVEEGFTTPPLTALEEICARLIEAVCTYAKSNGIPLEECSHLFVAKRSGTCHPSIELAVIVTDLAVLFRHRNVSLGRLDLRQAVRGIFISTTAILTKFCPGKSISEILGEL